MIASGTTRLSFASVKRKRKGKRGRRGKIYEEEEAEGRRKEGRGSTARLPFFPQTMQLSSGISPLAGDEGRADVISDKFLIAFHRGPEGLAFSLYLSALSYPRYRASRRERGTRGNQPALLLFNRVFLLITGVIPYVNADVFLLFQSQTIFLISAIPITPLSKHFDFTSTGFTR